MDGAFTGLSLDSSEFILIVVTSWLSLNGASFMIVSWFETGNDKKVMTNLILLLAIGDYFWALVNGAYTVIVYFGPDIPYALCVAERVVYQVFSLLTITATTSIATHIFLTIRSPTSTRRFRMRSFLAFSVAVPVAINVIILLFYIPSPLHLGDPFFSGDDKWCQPTRWFHLAYMVPVLLATVYIFVTITASLVIFYTKHTGMSNKVMIRLGGFLFVYLAVWMYDLVNVLRAIVDSELVISNPVSLLIIDVTVNASGFGNWIVYGISNSQIREKWSLGAIFFYFWIAPLHLLYILFSRFVSYLYTPEDEPSSDEEGASIRSMPSMV